MNCKETAELVSRSLEQKLSLWQRIKVRYHLRVCQYCVTYQKQLKKLRETMTGYREEVESGSDSPCHCLSERSKEKILKVLKEAKANEQ